MKPSPETAHFSWCIWSFPSGFPRTFNFTIYSYVSFVQAENIIPKVPVFLWFIGCFENTGVFTFNEVKPIKCKALKASKLCLFHSFILCFHSAPKSDFLFAIFLHPVFTHFHYHLDLSWSSDLVNFPAPALQLQHTLVSTGLTYRTTSKLHSLRIQDLSNVFNWINLTHNIMQI